MYINVFHCKGLFIIYVSSEMATFKIWHNPPLRLFSFSFLEPPTHPEKLNVNNGQPLT